MFDKIILVICVVALIAIGVGYPALMIRGFGAHAQRKATRSHLTLEDFAAEFGGSAVDPYAINAAYAELKERVGYPVMKDDHLESTLGIVGDDLDQFGEDVLQRIGIENPKLSDYTDLGPVLTAGDFARFLSEVLARQAASRAIAPLLSPGKIH